MIDIVCNEVWLSGYGSMIVKNGRSLRDRLHGDKRISLGEEIKGGYMLISYSKEEALDLIYEVIHEINRDELAGRFDKAKLDIELLWRS